MRRAGITGIGLWVPETVRTNDAWPPDFVQQFTQHRDDVRASDPLGMRLRLRGRPYDEILTKWASRYDDDPFKGTVERRIKDPTTAIAQGDAIAGSRALEDAGVHREDVDLVLSSAVLQDKLAPSNACAIQALLGCKNAAPLGVEAYCASVPAQIDFAAALVESGRARNVLCVTSHQISPVNDLRAPMSPLFGDGSCAFVVGEVPEGRGVVAVNRGGDGSLRDAVSYRFGPTANATWWRDIAGPVVAGTDDIERARFLADHLLRFPIDSIRSLLGEAGVGSAGVDVLAITQPLVWFPHAVGEGLGIPPARVPTTHRAYAHIGGAGIAANLLEARRRGLLRDGATVVLYAHGAGLTWYSTLVRWHSKEA
jgi:3-oxoacyl-[acyl-carrier-protein] synthase-3